MKKNFMLLITIVFVITGCNPEENYENAMTMLKQEKWKEAQELLNELPNDYNDVSILITYTNANIKFEGLDLKNTVEDYSEVLNLLNTITSENYNGVFKNDVESLIMRVSEKQKNYKEIINEEKLNNTISLVYRYKFKEALKMIDGVNHRDVDTIKNYINARIELDLMVDLLNTVASDTHWKKHLEYLTKINVDYNGILTEKINEFVAESGGWKEINENLERIYFLEENLKPKPKVGMTSDEVINSSWGKTNNINKTTTAYGTKEQWVYPGNRYIYFENGIVTTIQE